MGLRIALFGQAAFARDVLVGVAEAGHEVVAVYAPPEGARPDPLAEEAVARGLRLLRHRRFRRKGEAIRELLEEYRGFGAELNVMPFTTVILPAQIVEHPPRGSLCFHPSLLPRFRGGAAIPWQIILGERETGVTVFQPDAGVDTGPIVVQRGGIAIDDTDTAGTLYFRKLYPLGVEAVLDAVTLVASGEAKPTPQDESRASFQGLVTDEVARVDWSRPVEEIDRLVRGCDPQPGAHAVRASEPIRFFDARREAGDAAEPPGSVIGVDDEGAVLAARGGRIRVGRVRVGDGRKVPAAESGLSPGEELR